MDSVFLVGRAAHTFFFVPVIFQIEAPVFQTQSCLYACANMTRRFVETSA